MAAGGKGESGVRQEHTGVFRTIANAHCVLCGNKRSGFSCLFFRRGCLLTFFIVQQG
jgi:hypothetical protein